MDKNRPFISQENFCQCKKQRYFDKEYTCFIQLFLKLHGFNKKPLFSVEIKDNKQNRFTVFSIHFPVGTNKKVFD
jgi:hypothetical protein